MRPHFAGVVALLFCAGGPPRVWAGDDFWRERVLSAEELHRRGNLAEAAQVLESLLNLGPGSGQDGLPRATILSNLGVNYQALGRYSQAETCFTRAIRICERSPAGNDSLLRRLIGNLAALYIEHGEFGKAERLNIARFVKTPDSPNAPDPDRARLLTSLGMLAAARGRFSEAEQFQERALIVWGNDRRPNYGEARTHNALGVLYAENGRSLQALASFERAIETTKGTLNAEHPFLIPLLINVAAVHHNLRSLPAAEAHYRRAVAIAQAALADDHPFVAQILTRYAALLREMDRKQEANAMDRRAAAILEPGSVVDPRWHSVSVDELLQQPRGK